MADPDGEIAERYVKGWGRHRLDHLPAFYAFPVAAGGPAGRVIYAYYARKSAEPEGYLRRRVLKQFGIETTADVEPLVGHYPPAPKLALVDGAGKTHRLADLRGHVAIVVFITRYCPRCKAELDFLGDMLAAYGRAARRRKPWLALLAVCADAQGDTLRKFVADRGYRFPVGGDPDWAHRSAFRYRGATPDTFVVDPEGRIRFRHRGHKPDLDNVLHMEIRTLLGLDTRPLLGPFPHTGDRSCRICHAKQFADWALTRHACAWETLVRLGREADPKCVGCHVVGYKQYGGFTSARDTPHLADVQCESCHGGNGCAAFQRGRPKRRVDAATCAACHDAKHSPRFHFAAARPRILHNQSEAIARLPRAERDKRLARLCSGADRQLFDPDTPYVGSAACGTCHPTELKALAGSRHARAIGLLARPGRGHHSVPAHKRGVVGLRKAECLRCHVTGHGRPGGFPARVPADPLRHALAGVGCEACHGPGKAHVADPKKPRAIARLGGTCNECNILPICRQCHDDRNSPDFDYRAALRSARHPVGKAKTP